MKKQILMTLFLLFLGVLLSGAIQAQPIKISGKVTDASDGSPLIGVTIQEKGTTNGSVTDGNGNYNLTISPTSTLIFSYIGYAPQEITVSNRTSINVTMSISQQSLKEVVVIGYGTVKKNDATGSIVAVSSKDFNKGAITSPQDLLVGKSPGVVITNSGGAPGAGATIRVRGGSSLNASNDPLIIIDGVPISNSNIAGSSNFLSFINPNDIETFTVLKDASATAIYGSRASNGVILITTKRGKAGSKMSITYDGNTSIASAIKFVDVYSGDQMRQIALDHVSTYGAANLNLLGTANTNWQKEIFRTAVSQDHNLSITGSYKTLPYRASIGYTDQNGILKNTDMKRLTGSISLDPSLLNDNLKANINLKGMTTNNDFGDQGAIGSAVNMDPTQPVKDGNPLSDGYYQWSNYGANLGTPNPVEQLLAVDNAALVNRIIGNIQLNLKIPFIPGLNANLNLATDYTKSIGHNNIPSSAPTVLTAPLTVGRWDNYNSKNSSKLLDFYLSYSKDLASIQSKIDATAGYSWSQSKRESFNYTRDIYQKTDSTYHAPVILRLISFFGRVNYTFKDRYLLTLTVRDDGSSRFYDGFSKSPTPNQWGLFPSAALAWKIKEESFLKNVDAISILKLRLGWGITGQQDIGSDFPAQAIYTVSSPGSYYPIGGEYIPTLRPSAYDGTIKWERTDTKNIGLDFGFMKERITGSVDVYKRVTSNLLNTVTVPSGSNFSNTLFTNVGSLENKGVEASLNIVPISKKDMSLTIGLNLTYNVNKILKLLITDDPKFIGVLYGDAFTGQKQVTRVGYPAYSYFLNKQVYDANGNPIEGLYVDLSGLGGTVNGNNADKYIYHNPAPDYVLGFSARYTFKNLDISASARSDIGNYVYNQVAAGASYDQLYQIGYFKNFTTFLSDTKFVKRQYTSDYFVSNGSFLKLDNVSAGYRFDNIVDKLNARVSFTVQNVFTITKYKGIDPEVQGGIDNNFYPRPRTFMLGLSLTY